MRSFRSFIGIDLGGGKGKNTAVAHLRAVAEAGAARVEVVDYGIGKASPWYDEQLLAYLGEHPDALVAIDAPLSLPSVLRGASAEQDREHVAAVARWFQTRSDAQPAVKKPRYTPYTQRATEIILHEDLGLPARETLGQGMGPLTARAVYLRAALQPRFTINENLIEVYPKATLVQLFSGKLAGRYKRSAASSAARLDILNQLPELRFAPGAWREHGLANDHKFDALICAYTGYLFSRGACIAPPSELIAEDGWIWVPHKPPEGPASSQTASSQTASSQTASSQTASS